MNLLKKLAAALIVMSFFLVLVLDESFSEKVMVRPVSAEHGHIIQSTSVGSTPTPSGSAEISHLLLLPDLITLPPYEFDIINDRSAGNKILRLSNSIVNVGEGPLEVRADLDVSVGTSQVYQHIYYRDEEKTYQRLAGEFIFHSGHDHWHMDDFVHYELWTLTFWGYLDKLALTNDKVSYCLRDNTRMEGFNTPEKRSYVSCENEIQGISVGWVDTYRYYFEGQSINISELENGVYAIRSVADPKNNFIEINNDNNAAVVIVHIFNNRLRNIGSIEDYRGELQILYEGVAHGIF